MDLAKLLSLAVNSIKFDGATISKIDFTNAMLKNNNLSQLPDEYKEFLKETNGLIIPPYEFYGTEFIKRNGYNYQFPNIIDVNMQLVKNKNPLIENRVVIGSVFFDIIVFDNNDKKFKILNRLNFETIKIFDNFKQLFEYLQENI